MKRSIIVATVSMGTVRRIRDTISNRDDSRVQSCYGESRWMIDE